MRLLTQTGKELTYCLQIFKTIKYLKRSGIIKRTSLNFLTKIKRFVGKDMYVID